LFHFGDGLANPFQSSLIDGLFPIKEDEDKEKVGVGPKYIRMIFHEQTVHKDLDRPKEGHR